MGRSASNPADNCIHIWFIWWFMHLIHLIYGRLSPARISLFPLGFFPPRRGRPRSSSNILCTKTKMEKEVFGLKCDVLLTSFLFFHHILPFSFDFPSSRTVFMFFFYLSGSYVSSVRERTCHVFVKIRKNVEMKKKLFRDVTEK